MLRVSHGVWAGGLNFSVMLDRPLVLSMRVRGHFRAVGLTDENGGYDGCLCEEFRSVREGGFRECF